MQNRQVIENLRALIKALGITQEELFPTVSRRVIEMDEDNEDDDISLLTGKPSSSHLVRKPSTPGSTPATAAPVSTGGMLEGLRNVRSWDMGEYGGKISQVMKDGETPNFESSNDLSPTNPVDTMVDASLISDDDDNFGGLD